MFARIGTPPLQVAASVRMCLLAIGVDRVQQQLPRLFDSARAASPPGVDVFCNDVSAMITNALAPKPLALRFAERQARHFRMEPPLDFIIRPLSLPRRYLLVVVGHK